MTAKLRGTVDGKYRWLHMNDSCSEWNGSLLAGEVEIFSCEERIQWNYLCACVRILRKQLLAKYFAVVLLELDNSARI